MSAAVKVGDVHGGWTVEAIAVGRAPSGGRYLVRCINCGATTRRTFTDLVIAQGCRSCGPRGGRGKTASDVAARAREQHQVPIAIDIDTPFATDIDARALVLHFGGEMKPVQLAAAFGMSRERVRQIGAAALRKALREALRIGMTEDEVRAWLGRPRAEGGLARAADDPDTEPAVASMGLTARYPAPERDPNEDELEAMCDPWSDLGLRVARAIAVLEIEAEACERAAGIVIAANVLGEEEG